MTSDFLENDPVVTREQRPCQTCGDPTETNQCGVINSEGKPLHLAIQQHVDDGSDADGDCKRKKT
jgi:hypothetical protein